MVFIQNNDIYNARVSTGKVHMDEPTVNSLRFKDYSNTASSNYIQLYTTGLTRSNYYILPPNESGLIATRGWVEDSCGSELMLCNNLVRLMKVGKIVVCVFYGIDGYAYRNTTLIPDSAAEYRPYGVLFKSESDNYIATIDITQQGQIIINYKNAINTRGVPGNSGHKLYGNMAWFTS